MLTTSNPTSSATKTIAHIHAWAEELKAFGLVDEAAHAHLVQTLNHAAQGGVGKAQQPLLTVLLFGPSGVGKSQLLNALAGDVIARSDFVRPTTRIPTAYMHLDVDANRLFEYGTALGQMAQQETAIVRHTREALRHIVVIDAPDIDSYKTEHRERVMQLLPMMDVVLYVVTAQTYLNDLGWQTVLQERGQRAFAFVINKWDAEGKRTSGIKDAKDAKDAKDIDSHFLALLKARANYTHPRIFRTSAEYWLNAQMNAPTLATNSITNPISNPPPAGDQFRELQHWLAGELTTSHVAEIQRRRLRALWGGVAEAVSRTIPANWAAHPWRTAMQDALAALCADGLTAMKPTAVLNAANLAQAAPLRRWPNSPGPFGLLLRAGSRLRAAGDGVLQHGVPLQIGPLRTVANLYNPSQELTVLPAQTESLLGATGLIRKTENTLADLALSLQGARVPADWLMPRLRSSSEHLNVLLSEVNGSVLSELIAQPFGRVRRALGGLVLLLTEGAMLTVLGIAVWRLVLGFWSGSYVGGSFVAHFVLLLAVLAAFGLMGLSACFPDPQALITRRLEARLRQTWVSFVGNVQSQIVGFLETTDRLHQVGLSLKKSVDAELLSYLPQTDDAANELDGAGGVVESEMGRLFGEKK